jgi:tetratricopeptide (TPR) repeat protein
MIKKLFSKLFRFNKAQSVESRNIKTKRSSGKVSEVDMLLKQASTLKDKDIAKTIEIMKRVIELTPNNNQKYYFKLASYLHSAGSIDGAYKIYDDLMAELDENEVEYFNLKKSTIYEKLCSLNYKTGRYQDYMACYFYWLYNYSVGLAFSGNTKELNKIIKVKNKFSLMAPAKVDGCFKKLNKEDVKPIYAEKITEYFSSISEELVSVCKVNDKRLKKKLQDPKDQMEDIVYNELFKKYNSESEMSFYAELNSLLE